MGTIVTAAFHSEIATLDQRIDPSDRMLGISMSICLIKYSTILLLNAMNW